MATRGLVLLAKDTVSSVTSVSFDNVFSNTYKQYKLITNLTSASANNINLRLRASGADYSTNNHYRQYLVGSSSTVTAGRETNNTTWNGVGRVDTTNVSELSICEILNPFQSTYTTAMSNYVSAATGNIEAVFIVFGIPVTTSFDGFSIATGAFAGVSFSGTITLYGVAQ